MTKAERRALDAAYEFAAYAVTARDVGIDDPDFLGKIDVLESAALELPETAVRRWMAKTGFEADTTEMRRARGETL